jgi:hypothetical protein
MESRQVLDPVQVILGWGLWMFVDVDAVVRWKEN